MTKIILTDVDSTILDFHKSFSNFLIEQGIDTYGNLESIWDFKVWLRLPDSDIIKLLDIFYNSEYNATMNPIHNSKEIITKLSAIGYQFVAITAIPDEPSVKSNRLKNLHSVFGNAFVDCIHTGVMSSKYAALSMYEPTIWVEDSFNHALSGAKAGHISFCFEYPHNASQTSNKVTKIKSWNEIYDYIVTKN